MTLRDKIMDKYWLEFVASRGGNEVWYHPHRFWGWFYDEVMQKQAVSKKLEDYL